MVAYFCNPCYLGGRNWDDCGLRPIQAESYQDLISTNKLGVVVCICNSSYTESQVGGSWFKAQPEPKKQTNLRLI
jgi:hypothetical protein